MEFRLYPHPTVDICTPFVYNGEHNVYSRYYFGNSSTRLLSLAFEACHVSVLGSDEKTVLGERLPNRKKLLQFLRNEKKVSRGFLNFIKNNYVIPTFPINREEAIIKTMIRQVISSQHAKKLFSVFVKTFGYERGGIFAFPGPEQLDSLAPYDLKELGFGYKAERICSVLETLKRDGEVEVDQIKGIGPWSRSILRVESCRDYSLYPFWDKSAEKAKIVCGVDIGNISQVNKFLAGDTYIYAVSYLEAR